MPHSDQSLTAAALSELGTPNHVLRLGAGYSIELIEQIGLASIEQQMRSLTKRLRAGLQGIKGVRNAGPEEWLISSSITTIQLENGSPERCHLLVAQLREHYQIVTKFRPEVCGVRLSVAAFNTAAEIDRVLEALDVLVPKI
jgi:selenocysteine lyase/cysteine desulfurase